jgi:hypothetical protein
LSVAVRWTKRVTTGHRPYPGRSAERRRTSAPDPGHSRGVGNPGSSQGAGTAPSPEPSKDSAPTNAASALPPATSAAQGKTENEGVGKILVTLSPWNLLPITPCSRGVSPKRNGEILRRPPPADSSRMTNERRANLENLLKTLLADPLLRFPTAHVQLPTTEGLTQLSCAR